MKRILIIGCGDIALRSAALLNQQYRLLGLTRNPQHIPQLRASHIQPILGDLDQRASLKRLAGLADIVLHFAPPNTEGSVDLRTQNLLAALSRGRLPKKLIYISTSGVYGDCFGREIYETQPTSPKNLRAIKRVNAEQQLRRWAQQQHIQLHILRVPGIYAADRLPLARIQSGTPIMHADEDSYTNLIHAEDLANITLAAIRRGKPHRIYHANDDTKIKMGDWISAVAQAHQLNAPRRISRAEAEQTLPETLLSFLRESRQLNNQRLKQELKIKFRYPTIKQGLASHR